MKKKNNVVVRLKAFVLISEVTLKIDSALVLLVEYNYFKRPCRCVIKESLCVSAYHAEIKACYREALPHGERLQLYLLL